MRTHTLTVAMNGDVVGNLYRDGSGAMSFQYASEWLAQPGSRAILLSLPLQHSRLRRTVKRCGYQTSDTKKAAPGRLDFASFGA